MNNAKRKTLALFASAVVLGAFGTLSAPTPGLAKTAKIYSEGGIAIDGTDAVAYFIMAGVGTLLFLIRLGFAMVGGADAGSARPNTAARSWSMRGASLRIDTVERDARGELGHLQRGFLEPLFLFAQLRLRRIENGRVDNR